MKRSTTKASDDGGDRVVVTVVVEVMVLPMDTAVPHGALAALIVWGCWTPPREKFSLGPVLDTGDRIKSAFKLSLASFTVCRVHCLTNAFS